MVQLCLIVFVALQLNNIRAFTIQPRIINGDVSQQHQFPFYIYLQTISNPGEKGFACGGTLINDRWILTAAHCLERNRDIYIFGGIDQHGRFFGRQRINVTNQHIHPEYDNRTGAYDMALAESPVPIIQNSMIRPVRLPTNCGQNLDYQKVVAAGRGLISPDGSRDSKLRFATFKTMPRHVCYNAADRVIHPKSLICALSEKDQYVYSGDSGGPLVLEKDYTLVGVASFIQRFDNSQMAGRSIHNQAFQNIHFYFDWISRVTGIELPVCSRSIATFSSWEGVKVKNRYPVNWEDLEY